MTPTEAAEHARVSERTIIRADDRGELRSCRINGNGRRRYRRSWVDLWIAGSSHLTLMVVALLLTVLLTIVVLGGIVGDSCGVSELLRDFGLGVNHPPGRHG